MRFVDEFRSQALAAQLAAAIAREAQPGRRYRLMEFCGGHTHAIFRHGLQDMMPPGVEFIHGPGCPVCVLPTRRLDDAMELARRPEVTLCTYGDMMRVPGSRRDSLMRIKAAGADVRMIYSSLDAVRIACDQPGRQIVFFAIGFETTTPPTAVALLEAQRLGLRNFSVFCNHVLTPPAMAHIMGSHGGGARPVSIDGFLGPSHVSTVTGSAAYEPFVARHRKPVVIAGFEPLDVLQASLMALRQINRGEARVENQYTRVVTREGNRRAQALMNQVFEPAPSFEWRGLGSIPDSALRLRPAFAPFDAERRFAITPKVSRETKSCECPSILRGEKRPADCRLFGNGCTPESPLGACMVSSEGACAAVWAYGRHRAGVMNGGGPPAKARAA